MKGAISKLLLFFLILFISCKKDKTLILPDIITAGQKAGIGINYFDFEPDIACYISNAWEKQDTSISFDLNKDGIDDFIFVREIGFPGQLGSGFNKIRIISLDNNEVIVIPPQNFDTIIEPCMHSTLDWIDTLSVFDSINVNTLWTTNESLIYHSQWMIQQCSFTDGLWSNIVDVNDKYIGFKIVKDNKNYFGWIGLYRNLTNNIFYITDYAIIQDYEE